MPQVLDDIVARMSDLEIKVKNLDEKIDAELPALVEQSKAAAAAAVLAGEECRVAHEAFHTDRAESAAMRESVWQSIRDLDGKITDGWASLGAELKRVAETIKPLAPMIEDATEKKKHRDAWKTIMSVWTPKPKTAAWIGTISSAVVGAVAFWDQLKSAFLP